MVKYSCLVHMDLKTMYALLIGIESLQGQESLDPVAFFHPVQARPPPCGFVQLQK